MRGRGYHHGRARPGSLVILCLALAGAALYQLLAPLPTSLGARTGRSAGTEAGKGLQVPVLPRRLAGVDDGVIAQRPLFLPGRRPLAAPPASTAAAPAQARDADYALLGIVLTPKYRGAILQDRHSGTSVRVREGDSLGGYRLTQVARDHVILTRDGKRKRLVLPQPDAAPPAPHRGYVPGGSGVYMPRRSLGQSADRTAGRPRAVPRNAAPTQAPLPPPPATTTDGSLLTDALRRKMLERLLQKH